MCRTIAVILFIAGVSQPSLAAIEHRGSDIVLTGDAFAVTFSDTDGAIRSVTAPGRDAGLLHSGEDGLWRATWKEGGFTTAAAFSAGSATRGFQWSADPAGERLTLAYTGPDLVVTVTATALADGVDFTARVEPAGKTVLEFALPGRLRFTPDAVERLVCPMHSSDSVGAAFRSAFFHRQPPDHPVGWQTKSFGPSAFTTFFGAGPAMRPDSDPPVPISIAPDGWTWLGSDLAGKWNGKPALVNRPSARDGTTLVLADSANGPYFSGLPLGRRGGGYLFRIGGRVDNDQAQMVPDMVIAAIERLVTTTRPLRPKIALISLENGPKAGGWTVVPVATWRDRLNASAVIRDAGVEIVEFTGVSEMMALMGTKTHLAIVNPYGEYAPVPEGGNMFATAGAAADYVRSGGNWFEVGGYSFYYELRPTLFFSAATSYPPAFADFMHLDAADGSASLFGVQPMTWQPWAGAADPASIFVPGRLAWGGDEKGGYCERAFATYVTPGAKWQSPAVRLSLGHAAPEALAAYCQANGITRTLSDKMSPATLAAFKQSVLVFYDGSANQMLAHLDQLPAPALVHFTRYLQGGFDKQYPDHLSPNPNWGTPEEFKALLAGCRRRGLLAMPYTNPTWWCDHPRGPTFLREGEVPLLRKLDGSLSYESYGSNDGYTVCHWHPAVQAANRLTVRQFTEDYPIDVLFQDQCGARGWEYDTNPASPTPLAYSEGMVSMTAEDSRTKPLSTENGWDRIVNFESQLCGLTWSIVPTKNPPTWRTFLKDRFPPQTWELFPLAQYIAHDKLAFIHHDLGQFVTDDEVLSWTLGLGYNLSYRISTSGLDKPASRQWLLWLDRLQKSVCAKYTAEPVRSFIHDRGPTPSYEADGLIKATYGPVEVVANLNNTPVTVNGYELAPHGFRATAPNLIAANLTSLNGPASPDEPLTFVTEGDETKAEFWVYSKGNRQVTIELPAPIPSPATLQLDTAVPVPITPDGRTLTFPLPPQPDGTRYLFHATLRRQTSWR